MNARKVRPKRKPATPLATISKTKLHPHAPAPEMSRTGYRRIPTTELLKRYHFPATPASQLVGVQLRRKTDSGSLSWNVHSLYRFKPADGIGVFLGSKAPCSLFMLGSIVGPVAAAPHVTQRVRPQSDRAGRNENDPCASDVGCSDRCKLPAVGRRKSSRFSLSYPRRLNGRPALRRFTHESWRSRV